MSWRYGVAVGIFLALLSMCPQAVLIYERGSNYNGATFVNDNDESVYVAYLQAIIDGRVIADALATQPGPNGLLAYEALRRPVTTNVVLVNRKTGPERVLDIAAARVKGPQDRIEDLISPAELEEVAADYRRIAGFLKKAV